MASDYATHPSAFCLYEGHCFCFRVERATPHEVCCNCGRRRAVEAAEVPRRRKDDK